MFDPLALLPAQAAALLLEPEPTSWGGWAGQPAFQIPLAIGLLALVVLVILKLPDAMSGLRARHKEVLTPIQLEQLLHGAPLVVADLRTAAEFNGPQGHIRGARNIAMDQLLQGVAAVMPDPRQQLVLVDANDKLSHAAAAILQARGYTWVRVLQGGMRAWRAANLPVSVSGPRG